MKLAKVSTVEFGNLYNILVDGEVVGRLQPFRHTTWSGGRTYSFTEWRATSTVERDETTSKEDWPVLDGISTPPWKRLAPSGSFRRVREHLAKTLV